MWAPLLSSIASLGLLAGAATAAPQGGVSVTVGSSNYSGSDRYGSYSSDVQYLGCSSKNRRARRCDLPYGAVDIRFEKRRSDASCRKGRDWGIARGDVWVDNGCRATFSYRIARRGSSYGDRGYSDRGYKDRRYDDRRYGDRRYDDRGYGDRGYGGRGYDDKALIRCESDKRRTNRCALPRGANEVRLVDRRSDAPCRRGTDWGVSKREIWVTNGCRGIFSYDPSRRDGRAYY